MYGGIPYATTPYAADAAQAGTVRVILGQSRITRVTGQTTTGVSRVQVTVQRTNTGKSRVTVTTSRTTSGVSRITLIQQRTITGLARVINIDINTKPYVDIIEPLPQIVRIQPNF